MNEFKEIFSEYLLDLAIAVKAGKHYSKTPYMITRDFAVNFDIPPYLSAYLLDSLEDKEIYYFLLNY